MKLIMPVAEGMVQALAANSKPGSAAHLVLEEGALIKAKGNQVRYWLTDEGLCAQEGVAFISTSEQ